MELNVAYGYTPAGVTYLKVYVKPLVRAGLIVGGILGEDNRSDAARPLAGCSARVTLEAKPDDMHHHNSSAFASH